MGFSGALAPPAAEGPEEVLERFQRELDQALETTKDDVRTVHLEVMSVDTRLAALEERARRGQRCISPETPVRDAGSSMKGGIAATAFANSMCSGRATGIAA